MIGVAHRPKTAGRIKERVKHIRRTLRPAGTGAFLWRKDLSGIETYWLAQHIGSGRYWGVEISNRVSSPAGFNCWGLRYSSVLAAVLAVVQTDGSWVFSGTWSNIATGFGLVTYKRSTTAGSHATYTAPLGSTRVGLRWEGFSNNGLAGVAIDGDKTAAKLLPTAQELVDAGTAPNTILAANGGFFAPTDRVLDQFSSPSGIKEALFVDDLDPGVQHTARIYFSGHKRTAASDTRVHVSYGLYGTADTTPDTANALIVPGLPILNSGSVWERALRITPVGGSTSTFIGGTHGYETGTDKSLTVDGAPVTLANGAWETGESVVFTRETEMTHPDTGASLIATTTCDYTMDTDGLLTEDVVSWLVDSEPTEEVEATGATYIAMFPLNRIFDKGTNPVLTSDVTVTDNDNSTKAKAESPMLAMWESSGHYAVYMELLNPNEAVEQWRYVQSPSGESSFIQDRSDNFEKMYMNRGDVSGGELIENGDIWTIRVRRKLSYLDDADAELAL